MVLTPPTPDPVLELVDAPLAYDEDPEQGLSHSGPVAVQGRTSIRGATGIACDDQGAQLGGLHAPPNRRGPR